MKNKTLIILSLTAGLLALAACQTSPTSLPPGKYQNETTKVDSNGTETTNKTSTDVQVDEYGNKKATTETETTRDPKGLFNKTTTKSTRTSTEQHY